MKDICIIPAFNRPEYLFFTLYLLRKATLHETLKYIFALDYGYSKKCEQVIEENMQGLDYEIVRFNGSHLGAMKQSYNLLSAYHKAAQEARQYVFLIEDDIFIGKSFFTAHYQIHAKYPNIFCSVGSKLHNHNFISPGKEQTLNPATCQMSTDSVYQSWGVCFNKFVLQKHILPNAFTETGLTLYFTSPARYMQLNFPKHFLGTQFTEQDGLIRRCCDASQLGVGYPDYPRCYHAGIWSYHRLGEKVQGWTYERRLAFIRDTCFDAVAMDKYNDYNDVFVADLDVDDAIM